MKIWCRAFDKAFSFMLKRLIWTNPKLPHVMNLPFFLLISKFGHLGVCELKDFIPTLLHYGQSGPVRICHDDVRRFKVYVSTRLKTPWLKKDV